MFFTIASKLPFIDGDKKLVKMFIIGAILYTLLHYYLFSAPRMELLDRYKQYLYYIMPFDFGIAYYLTKQSKSQDEQNKYTPEQIKIMQMQAQAKIRAYQEEMRRQQQPQQIKSSECSENDNQVTKSPFKKKDSGKKDNSSENKEQQVSQKEQSKDHQKESPKESPKEEKHNSDSEKKAKKETKKVEKGESDTYIPPFPNTHKKTL
jgi:hypothetical protein